MGHLLMKRKPTSLGRYIAADPRICHGQPTFCSIRVFVADVLEQVTNSLVWESIIEEWHGSITKEAIAEAVQLASRRELGQDRENEQRSD